MTSIPVTVNSYDISVTVTETNIVAMVNVSTVEISVTVNSGLSQQQVEALLTKENVAGLKIANAPEFADTQITGLQSIDDKGLVPKSVYDWFKGLFTSLTDKSVLSFFIGILTILRDVMTRIGLLEDKYILKYIVPSDCTEIELTADRYGNPFNFVEGDVVEISTSIVPFVGEGNNRLNLRVNGITSYNYLWATLLVNYFVFAGSAYYGHSGTIVLRLLGKGIVGTINSHIFFTETTYSNQTYQIETRDIDIESINSLELFAADSQYPIPAGTEILIKKL